MNNFAKQGDTIINKSALLDICNGDGPSDFPRLPRPNMLMLDRITQIETRGGKYGLGYINGEFDIDPKLWFFDCHFSNDPIMPGSLGVDGMGQLLGFFLGYVGFQGQGRALGVGKIRYKAEIKPLQGSIHYQLNIRTIKNTGFPFAIADGTIRDENTVFTQATGISVGIRPIPADCETRSRRAITEEVS
jgi:3-hydroxyacyl-[acyl-carrier protein] dehydratase / trans-2-decenoyl-[acyl-carrier protein] isomerase